ncbi:MAG TPA: eL32 family ribosomal protein [Candidatus Acidoferrum sp.]|nr:eL32 family ribosomal protein [Candidatus Acidoferrum sp.]
MMIMQKKSHPKFNIPNYGAKSRKRVPERWRKQRGIDNKKRIKKDFMGATPGIGYANPKSLRHVRASGRRLTVVHNLNELRAMTPEARKMYDVAIAHDVSKRKRIEIIKAAAETGVQIVNRGVI